MKSVENWGLSGSSSCGSRRKDREKVPFQGGKMEPNRSSQFTGVAGVHYVAAYLANLGFHAVTTTRNIAGPDVLVSKLDGSSGLSLQVKTTAWAMRERGRGRDRKPHHYEWDIGWGSARHNHPLLFFALVDLKNFDDLPDVFILPSEIIFEYFKAGPEGWPRARYHPEIEEVAKYRNNWGLLKEKLEQESNT